MIRMEGVRCHVSCAAQLVGYARCCVHAYVRGCDVWDDHVVRARPEEQRAHEGTRSEGLQGARVGGQACVVRRRGMRGEALPPLRSLHGWMA